MDFSSLHENILLLSHISDADPTQLFPYRCIDCVMHDDVSLLPGIGFVVFTLFSYLASERSINNQIRTRYLFYTVSCFERWVFISSLDWRGSRYTVAHHSLHHSWDSLNQHCSFVLCGLYGWCLKKQGHNCNFFC